MASTFQPTVNNGGKFLPQVVATPHQVRTEDVFTKRGTAPMNMTGGFSTFNKGGGLIESMQDTNLSMSVDVKMETPTMPDDDYVQKTPMSQVPQNSSKIDFKFTFPQPTTRKKVANQMKQKHQVRQTSFGQMTVPKVQQILPLQVTVQHPSPKHMIGIGYHHSGLSLTVSGASQRNQGVFIKTHRSPILTLDNSVHGPCPPSLREYTESGRLLSDPLHSLAAISNSNTKSGKGSNFNEEKLREQQARTLANQNSSDLFQSKQFLMDHSKAMVEQHQTQQRLAKHMSPVAVKSIKSISTRKKSVFK